MSRILMAKEIDEARWNGEAASDEEAIAIAQRDLSDRENAEAIRKKEIEWLKEFFIHLKSNTQELGIKGVGEPEKVKDEVWELHRDPIFSASVVAQLLAATINQFRQEPDSAAIQQARRDTAQDWNSFANNLMDSFSRLILNCADPEAGLKLMSDFQKWLNNLRAKYLPESKKEVTIEKSSND